MSDTIVWFSALRLKDRPIAGGKGASLGELASAGIAVPDGFVVTTHAFNQFLHSIDPEAEIRRSIAGLRVDDLAGIKARSREIHARILASELPETLRQGISDACAQLGDHPLAVRSSATSEDSEEASFAGLQDTYLWVRGQDAVLDSLRACWASLYSPESISYRLRLNLPEDQLAMGVVVQQMVDARCAGVMFTRSPTTGDRSVVTLEAAWGLGSSLVSGEVTPDKYVINKITGEIIQRDVARKHVAHVPLPEGGVQSEAVDDARQQQPCLSDDEIRALCQSARQVEQHYGSPQDIEWAIARDSDQILLLQSRPETVWASRDQTPVAKPAARAFDHIFATLGGQERG